jgi:hypothetical protein
VLLENAKTFFHATFYRVPVKIYNFLSFKGHLVCPVARYLFPGMLRGRTYLFLPKICLPWAMTQGLQMGAQTSVNIEIISQTDSSSNQESRGQNSDDVNIIKKIKCEGSEALKVVNQNHIQRLIDGKYKYGLFDASLLEYSSVWVDWCAACQIDLNEHTENVLLKKIVVNFHHFLFDHMSLVLKCSECGLCLFSHKQLNLISEHTCKGEFGAVQTLEPEILPELQITNLVSIPLTSSFGFICLTCNDAFHCVKDFLRHYIELHYGVLPLVLYPGSKHRLSTFRPTKILAQLESAAQAWHSEAYGMGVQRGRRRPQDEPPLKRP